MENNNASAAKPVTIINISGEVQTLRSIKEAAEVVETTRPTLRRRIDEGIRINGWLARWATDKETSKSFNLLVKTPRNIATEMIEEEEELDDKYPLISYQTIHNRVCVTVCPHHKEKGIKIGSALCMKCSSNHGRSKKNQKVACSRRV